MNYIDTTLFLPYYLKDTTERLLDDSIGKYTYSVDVIYRGILNNLTSVDDDLVRALNSLMYKMIYQNPDHFQIVCRYFPWIDPYETFKVSHQDVLSILKDNNDDRDKKTMEYEYSDIFSIRTHTLYTTRNASFYDDSWAIDRTPNGYPTFEKSLRNMLIIYVYPGLTNILGKELNLQDSKLFIRGISDYIFDYIKTNIGIKEALLSEFNYSRLL